MLSPIMNIIGKGNMNGLKHSNGVANGYSTVSAHEDRHVDSSANRMIDPTTINASISTSILSTS
jgi:hypothetical protein